MPTIKSIDKTWSWLKEFNTFTGEYGKYSFEEFLSNIDNLCLDYAVDPRTGMTCGSENRLGLVNYRPNTYSKKWLKIYDAWLAETFQNPNKSHEEGAQS